MKKAIASAVILIWLTVAMAGAVMLGERFGLNAWWAQLLYFAAAGVVWAVPLIPVLQWANAPKT